MKTLFVCRGTTRDGLGHVIRSRTLAQEMSKTTPVRMVVGGDGYVHNLLEGRGIEFSIVGDDAGIGECFRDYKPEVVVFDLLHIDRSIFSTIRNSSFTASLSPIFNCLRDVDVAFHRTSVLGEWSSFKGSRPVIRSGLEYAIVGEHCSPIAEKTYKKSLQNKNLSLAISMGGTDAANKTLEVLETLKHIREQLLLWVFLGEGYIHSYEDLVRSIRGSKHEIILAKTNDSMWRILSTCSLVILAGGTTSYEAVYANLPAINTLESKKHYFLIQELVEKGACFCAGKDFYSCTANLNQMIEEFNSDRGKLLKVHQSCKSLIDGLATERIVKDITDLLAAR